MPLVRRERMEVSCKVWVPFEGGSWNQIGTVAYSFRGRLGEAGTNYGLGAVMRQGEFSSGVSQVTDENSKAKGASVVGKQ